jgi:hypothetical protein
MTTEKPEQNFSWIRYLPSFKPELDKLICRHTSIIRSIKAFEKLNGFLLISIFTDELDNFREVIQTEWSNQLSFLLFFNKL